jgi:hypothetical protein
MTIFHRRSYTRYSKYGIPHTVRGSLVERNDWSRSVLQSESWRDYHRRQLHNVGAGSNFAATFVNPNARCPVCGAQVFYYQNEWGSRVFFDDLGKPWPKHPCTDNPRFTRPSAARTNTEEPKARSLQDADAISSWLGPAEVDPEGSFKSRFGLRPWTPYVLQRKVGTSNGCLIVLAPLRPRCHPIFVALPRAPRGLREDAVVFHHRGIVSYFDLRSMTDKEVTGVRLRSAEAFVKELLRPSEN